MIDESSVDLPLPLAPQMIIRGGTASHAAKRTPF
jgi:hypothetical protein